MAGSEAGSMTGSMTGSEAGPPDALAGAPAEAPASTAPQVERGPKLRRALLAKLPRLGYHANIADAVKVDSDAELRSLVELEADALLEPLQRVAPRRSRE
ncbi:hypothetical protein [Pyxidicoccus caerfyrddinensis]|uniref:hypothetical protein n=1 Tax=Pyxidicoccus caerfyrddinensis TaxID=2709663 RepID=UPI0013DCC5E2|nr:hypothetical protein [Pyxidicoccus caerfyrddinensis]